MAKTVLVVEDNDFTCNRLGDIQISHAQEAVDAGYGQDAVDRLVAGPPPNVIFLDLVLHVVDWNDFLKRLRATPRLAPPVFLVTGTDVSDGWEETHGCGGLLQKLI